MRSVGRGDAPWWATAGVAILCAAALVKYTLEHPVLMALIVATAAVWTAALILYLRLYR